MERLQDRIEEYEQKEADSSKLAPIDEFTAYQSAFDPRNPERAQTFTEPRQTPIMNLEMER